ncbi:hypothetical protein BDR05DRAFT_349965 [Suillus weaverae]|nr:hypothetical protein BDR05DRAFT_349965 [Suillus weaverae]
MGTGPFLLASIIQFINPYLSNSDSHLPLARVLALLPLLVALLSFDQTCITNAHADHTYLVSLNLLNFIQTLIITSGLLLGSLFVASRITRVQGAE